MFKPQDIEDACRAEELYPIEELEAAADELRRKGWTQEDFAAALARELSATPHQHQATGETHGHIYEVCECGAVRTLNRDRGQYDEWHACRLCVREGGTQNV